jgi:hypothetical protein
MKGEPAMRSVLAFLMTAASIGCAQMSANSPCPDKQPAVTVQIHDYVHLNGESLAKARDIVTRAYRNVGVGIAWLPDVIQQDLGGKSSTPPREGAHASIPQLTINILSPAMAARGGVPANVLGFVAVPTEGGMGRIGYVVYDHVPEIASAVQTGEGEILGAIVAHDIRRLILGNDSQSDEGAASDSGDGRKHERVNPLALSFSSSEVARLHSTLQNDASSFPGATVGTSGTDPQHQCVTGSDGIRQ